MTDTTCPDCGYLTSMDGEPCECACTAEGCWACDNPYCYGSWCRLDRLTNNLKVAGALCEAFARGYEHTRSYHPYHSAEDWHPGCNLI